MMQENEKMPIHAKNRGANKGETPIDTQMQDITEKRSGKDMDPNEKQGSLITDYGQITLSKNRYHHRIHLLNIIGEIEGHENLGASSKTSKYEHILPQLAAVEDDEDIDGL
ncbi:MAG: peptidase S14, partial [Clostridium sp.]|nr:peptidase S14 [Clostridium sp.]